MEKIREKLFELQDKKYQEFNNSVCPNANNIIGVRIPELRKLAKQIAKENPEQFLSNTKTKYYEEKMLYGFVIGYQKTSMQETFSYLDKFVPMIDNWAVCDCCCSTFKFTQKYLEEMWNYLQKYIESDKEYELRFVIVMLMTYYLQEKYIDQVLEIYNKIKHEGYYVKMGIAWGISVAYVKFPEKTMAFLNKNNLDDFTYNKALQKMIESYRVDNDTKELFKNMKRK